MEAARPIDTLLSTLALPVIVAPMFALSGPELVIAACTSGVIGSFNSLNAQSNEEFANWLDTIETAIESARDGGDGCAPVAVNLIVRKSDRYAADLATIERHKPPIVITSVGSPADVVARVHGYGGLIFHDVATLRHAEKAIEAGVDGLILLTAGAGGHTGHANPFAFAREMRAIWDGALILAGAIGDGRAIRAAQMLGADLAYMGTRFAATTESRASAAYKAMLVESQMADVLVTDRISGLAATFLRPSIAAAGLDPANLPPLKGPFTPDLPGDLRPWRDIWSAGHGVGVVRDVPTTAELVARLAEEYRSL